MNSNRLELLALVVIAGGACTGSSTGTAPSEAEGSDTPLQAENTDAGTRNEAGEVGTPAAAAPVIVQVVRRTDIVSNRRGALAQDQGLLNAWGLAFSPQGLAWALGNGSGKAEVFTATGAPAMVPVTIPPPPGTEGPSAPTAPVFNSDATVLSGDRFVFVTEGGTIAGWQPSAGPAAMTRVDNSGNNAIYKGAALATEGQKTRLFATNFRAGTVDVFDESYKPVQTAGGFKDPGLPAGFAPFNVAPFQNGLVVTYARQAEDRSDDVHGPGLGFVDLFDFDGKLIVRLISQGALNAPWGVAMSTTNFGDAPFRIYIGNFGDGTIHVYRLESVDDRARLVHEGQLGDANGRPLVIDGLWALAFGPDADGFSSSSLYFTAGPDDEQRGVFGKLDLR